MRGRAGVAGGAGEEDCVALHIHTLMDHPPGDIDMFFMYVRKEGMRMLDGGSRRVSKVQSSKKKNSKGARGKGG